jgi:hypothetical protein
VVIGSIATATGIFGLLLNAVAVVWISRLVASSSGNPTDRFGPSMLLALQNLLTVVALLVALVLISRGRDAGRSAAIWIAAGALPWLILTAIALIAAANAGSYPRTRDNDQWVSVAVALGLAGVVLAVVGLVTAMILLGQPAGRRWIAENVFAGGDRSWPPRPLLATTWRFGLSAALGVGGGLLLVALIPLSSLGQEEGAGIATVVFAVILTVTVVLPELLAALGAWGARRGRRGGAIAARVAGGLAVLGFPVFTLLAVFMVATSYYGSSDQIAAAALPPPAVATLGVLVIGASLAGLALFVAGLAGLADPRSEVYLRRPATPIG